MAVGFGSQFASRMILSQVKDDFWTEPRLVPTGDLLLDPAAHVLHYGSSCFEGLKAYRHEDQVAIFRLDKHVERMRASARLMCLPQPSRKHLTNMINQLVSKLSDEVPPYPSALYLRPVLLGCDANIGKAAKASNSALLYVLASPVGTYFDKGEKPLKLLVVNEQRTTPDFGQVKTGGNYASALRHVVAAREKHHVDQVLFCPGGDVQETGAANFLLINDSCIITKRLDGSILPGVTRASVLEIAKHLGYRIEERDINVHEMLEFIKTGEAALSGTAAVLAPVGSLIFEGVVHNVGDGEIGEHLQKLRSQLTGIQSGQASDEFGWITYA